jgi:glycosyltransferase involved in cell wall biosynthesis
MKVAEAGHRIIVIQPPSRKSSEANDIDVILPSHNNIEIKTIAINSFFWRLNFPLDKLFKKMYFTVKSSFVIKRIMRKENIDLLYLYNIPQMIYLFRNRTCVVFDFADDLLGMLEVELSISPSHPIYKFAQLCLQWIVKRSDFTICISEPLYKKILHPNKFIIANGTNLFPYVSQTNNDKNSDEYIVGYVGAFEYSMAIEQIILVAEQMPEISFLLIGAGRDFNSIQSDVQRKKLANITMTGALPHQDAMAMVQKMDICLNLFKKTNVSHAVSPLKLFEYFSMQKPVISTRLQEVERINEDFIYFADTVDEIKMQINYIYAHRNEALEKAKKGYEIVKQKYTWEILAKQFIDASQQCCNKPVAIDL